MTEKNEQMNGVALDFTEFQKAYFQEMRRYLETSQTKPRKYSKDQIRRFMENPRQFERQLREVSIYLLNTSSHYYRMAMYFATMLTLDWVLVPLNINKERIQKDVFKRESNRVNKYLESINIKEELGKIVKILVAEDVFFGIEREVGNSVIIQRLPTNYCQITGYNEGGYVYQFNLRYFDNEKKNIENYPEEIQLAYKRYKDGTIKNWYEIQENAVCFKLNSDLDYSMPMLSGIFEEVMDLEDLRELAKKRSKVENFKLLLQKIPMKKDPKSEKDFVLTLDSVKTFHNSIKSHLPDGISVVSTPMDLEGISFERNRKSSDEHNLAVTEEQLYNRAGISSTVFNSDKSGSIGLNRSLEVDQNIMFTILRQFEKYFKYRLSRMGNKSYQFKLMFLDMTNFNKKEVQDRALKAAQFGMSKSYLASTMGYTVNDLVSLTQYENEYLELTELLEPLSSSHTSSGKETGERGRPKKDETDLSDKGAETRDNDANKDRGL